MMIDWCPMPGGCLLPDGCVPGRYLSATPTFFIINMTSLGSRFYAH